MQNSGDKERGAPIRGGRWPRYPYLEITSEAIAMGAIPSRASQPSATLK